MTLIKILLLTISAVGALLIEIILMGRDAVSTLWDVCIVGNEKAAVRRRFK